MKNILLFPVTVIAISGFFGCNGDSAKSTQETSTDAAKPAAVDRGPGNEPTAEELGGAQDTLVVAVMKDVDSLNPVVSQSATDTAVLENLLIGTLDSDFDCGIKYKSQLVESWSWDETHTIMTQKLSKQYKWKDGTPVTAKDIKFTYDLIADKKVASARIGYIEYMKEGKRPQLVDDYTLEWHFTHAYDETTMIAHTGMSPVPMHVLKDADRATLRGHKFNREPLVNGPWKIEKWEPGSRIVLSANENFSGPAKDKPRLKRVIYKILPEPATRLVELENGSVDLIEGILPTDIARLRKEHPEISLRRRGWRFMDYVAWNQFDAEDYKAKGEAKGERDWSKLKRHSLFGDKAIRRALTKAINIQKLIDDLLTPVPGGEQYGRAAVSTISPEICGVHNDEIKRLPFSVAEAKKDLEALGWKDTDGDGLLDKDGKKFSFKMLTNSGNARRAKASIIIQANLKAIGVDMQIEHIETNTFFERLRKKDYEAALGGWSAGLFVDMTTMWHSGDKYEFNFTGYNNPDVDALMKKALREPDPTKNAALWKEVQAKIYEDQPYTFLFWRDEVVGIHKRFRDAKIDILSAYRDLATWWVPKEEVKYKR